MRRLALPLLLLAVLGTRALWPDLDPPYLSWSRGEYTDPGFYLNNARSLVLTGDYMIGDWNNGILFPIFHSLAYGAYRLGGDGPVPISALMATVAALTVGVLFLWLRRHLSSAAGWLGGFWFAVAAPLLLLGRVPILENLLLLLITALLAVVGWNETRWRHGVLLVLVLLALGTKYSALFIIIPLLGVTIARRRGWLADTPPSRAEWGWFWLPLLLLAGLALGALLVFKPTVLLVTLGDKLTRYQTQSFYWNSLTLPVRSNLFWRLPWLTLSAWLGFGVLLFRERRWRRTDAFAVLAIIGWYLSIVFIRYNPLRYQLPVIPFLLYLAVRFWTVPPGEPVISPGRIAAWLVAGGVLVVSAVDTLNRSLGWTANGLATPFGVMGLGFIGFVGFLLCRQSAWRFAPRHLILAGLAIVAVSVPQLRSEWRQRDDRLATIGREVGQLVPPGETLAGWYAPSVSLHNRVRVYTTYTLTPEKIAANRIRYLLLETWGPGTPPLAAVRADELGPGTGKGPLAPLRDRLHPLGEWTIPRIGRSLALYEVVP